MKKTTLITFFLISCIFLNGCSTSQQTNDSQKTVISQEREETKSKLNFVEVFINEQERYKLEYPSYFTIDDTRKDYVIFSNSTCEQNNKLCFMGIDGFQVSIIKNSEYKDIGSYYENWKKTCPQIKKLKILQLPENFNADESYDAIRCEFDEVPKQAKGGYSYVIFDDKKVFSIDFFQGDGYITSMNKDGNTDNIKIDKYDPLGDMIMKTFRVIK